MTEVEKYGLFAVVAVAALVTAIAVWGDGPDEAVPKAAAAGAGAPRSIAIKPPAGRGPGAPGGAPVEPVGTAGAAGASAREEPDRPATVPVQHLAAAPAGREASGSGGPRVKPLVAARVPAAVDLDGRFDFGELPQPYPGERSSAPATQPKATAGPSAATHVVAPGETLSEIARARLGSAGRWRELLELNPGVDPDRLRIGEELVLDRAAAQAAAPQAAAPKAAAPEPAAVQRPAAGPSRTPATASLATNAAAARTHTVQAGDTLGGLAQRYLGTVRRSHELYEANRDVLASPDTLRVGQVLRIPGP